MAVRTFGGKFSSDCLTSEQRAAIIVAGIDPDDIIDTSCTSPLLNTCGRDSTELLSQYPLYDPEKGIYTEWGEIDFPWNAESPTIDNKWKVARYIGESSYLSGDTVIIISDDGFGLTLYTAIEDLPVPAGVFNPSLWQEVCNLKTSEPLNLPPIEELETEYDYFDPEQEYTVGQVVLRETGCGDSTCVLVVSSTNPITLDKLYCVPNGKPSTCGKVSSCGDRLNRKIVSLSTPDSDNICVPVESNIAVGPRR